MVDEDFESQVDDVTLDAPESREFLSNNVEESKIPSSSMSCYYPYTCMLSNFVLFDAL